MNIKARQGKTNKHKDSRSSWKRKPNQRKKTNTKTCNSRKLSL